MKLPSWQFPLSENTVPSGQTHATVLVGKVSDTTHLWFPVQGLFIWQGFWHLSFIHASLDGQSWSTLHSGSSILMAISVFKMFKKFLILNSR